jgi:hypothetical protein
VSIPIDDIDDIDDVLRALDDVIAEGVAGRHPYALFAALYKRITVGVKRGIEAGIFDDGDRMSHFDAIFARRYFAPLRAHQAGEPVPLAWALAFEALSDPRLTAMQLLLLSVNAHINLDLGFAVFESGVDTAAFEDDFVRVNDILANELENVQEALDQFSPWLERGDRWMGRTDERLGVFVVVRSRAQAWDVAQVAAKRTAMERAAYEADVDETTAALGQRIAYPGLPLSLLVRLIRWRESWTVPRLVEALVPQR